MITTRPEPKSSGFTLIEMLCVIAIIATLAAFLLPALSQGRIKARRVQCLAQLRQSAVAFQSFAHDHNNRFPMAVSTEQGGFRETLASNGVFSAASAFQTLAAELVTPRVLACPSDTRLPTASFATLRNENLSYFLGLQADMARPNSILAGDRNLTNDFTTPDLVLNLGPNHSLRWTHELHRFKGNLLFSDGHVEEKNGLSLLQASGEADSTAQLFVPGDSSRQATFTPSTARPSAKTANRPDRTRGQNPSATNPAAPAGQSQTTATQTPTTPPPPAPPAQATGDSSQILKASIGAAPALTIHTTMPPSVVAAAGQWSPSHGHAALAPLCVSLWLLLLLLLIFLVSVFAVEARRRSRANQEQSIKDTP